MKEVQKETPWKIDFESAAKKMGKDIHFVAEVLKIKPETIEQMQRIQPQTDFYKEKANARS